MSGFFTAYGRNPALRGRMTQLGQVVFNTRMQKDQLALEKEKVAVQKEQLEVQKASDYARIAHPIFQQIANATGEPYEVPEWAREAYGLPDVQKTQVKDIKQTASQEKTGQVPTPEIREGLRKFSVDPLPLAGEAALGPEQLEALAAAHPLIAKRSEEMTGDPYLHIRSLAAIHPKAADLTDMLIEVEKFEQKKLDDESVDPEARIEMSPMDVQDMVVQHPNFTARQQEEPGGAEAAILRLAQYNKDKAGLLTTLDRMEDNARMDIEKGINPLKLTQRQLKGMAENYSLIAEMSTDTFKNPYAWFEEEVEVFTSEVEFRKYLESTEKMLMAKAAAVEDIAGGSKEVNELVMQHWNEIHDNMSHTLKPADGFMDFQGNFKSLEYENAWNTAMTEEIINYCWSALTNPDRAVGSPHDYARQLVRLVNRYMYTEDVNGKKHRIYVEGMDDLKAVIREEELVKNPKTAAWLLNLLPNTKDE